jgi:osmotically inducible protein OsmC
MATIKKSASAVWSGGLKDGTGQISTQSGAMKENPYGFNTRFEDQPGTNPEELIGAAHASCFTMALAGQLGEAGMTAKRLETKATVSLEKADGGFAITAVHLDLVAEIPGADKAAFEAAANRAKANCPVSKLLNANITMDARLQS